MSRLLPVGGYLEDFSNCAPGDFSLPLVERVTLYGCTGPASSPRPGSSPRPSGDGNGDD